MDNEQKDLKPQNEQEQINAAEQEPVNNVELEATESVDVGRDQAIIRQQLEAMDLDEDSKMQAHAHATGLQSLETKEKLDQLLQIAKSKGVVYAVAVAKKMNDPFMLDTFHDALAREGYYKKFEK